MKSTNDETDEQSYDEELWVIYYKSGAVSSPTPYKEVKRVLEQKNMNDYVDYAKPYRPKEK